MATEPKKKLHWATRILFVIAALILFLDFLSLLILPQMMRHGGVYDMFALDERGQLIQSLIGVVRRAIVTPAYLLGLGVLVELTDRIRLEITPRGAATVKPSE